MGVAVNPGDRAPGDGFLVLWLGGPGRWEPAVQAQLAEAGVRVEDSGLDVLVERASQRAPDLIVLTGAAAGAPRGVLEQLASSHPARTVPVVAVVKPDQAKPKPRSRFGLVALLDREAGAAELTKQLLALLRGLSRRSAKWRIKAGRADIPVIADRFVRTSRSGLLTARGGGGVAFDVGGGFAPAPEMLVSSIASRDVEHLAFYERAPGQVTILEDAPRDEQTAPPLIGARVLIVDSDQQRSGRLCARLETAQAQVRVLGPDRGAITVARSLDPTLIIVSALCLAKDACEPFWLEPRLASASLMVLTERAISAPPNYLLSPVAELCATEQSIRRRLEAGEAIAERLATLGTARWLKVLGRCKDDVTFRVYASAGRGRVDIREGRVRGAAFRPADTRMAMVEGRAAVDTLLGLPFGRVLAGPAEGIKKIEGVRGSRKLSMVGQVTVKASRSRREGLAARRGLVSEEVVAVHGASRRPTPLDGLTPGEPRRDPTTRPPPSANPDGALTPLDSERGRTSDSDFEEPTRNYNASAMAQLQAELRTAAKVSAPLGDEAGVRVPSTRRGAAPSPAARRRSSEPPAATKPRAPKPRAPKPRALESAAPETAAPETAAPETAAAESATRAPTPALAPPSRDSAPPTVSPLPKPILSPPAPAQQPSSSSSGTAWFAAGIVLALGVGGYAAWQLSPSDEQGEPTNIEPGPETTAHDRDPGSADADPSTDDRSADPAEDPPDPERRLDGDPRGPAGSAPESPDPEDPSPAQADPAVAVAPGPAPADPEGLVDSPSEAATELIERAIAAARDNDYPESERLSRLALARSPGDGMAAYRLAVALYRQQRHEEALDWAQRSVHWDPRQPRAHSIQGDIHMRTGHFQSAAEAYRAALNIERNYGPAQRGLDRLRARGVVE